jgi:hypothetical protein
MRDCAASMARAVGNRSSPIDYASNSSTAPDKYVNFGADLDHIAAVTSQPVEWIAARGSLP